MCADRVEIKNFDLSSKSLDIKVHGHDRPGVIARITARLEENRLYPASITFNLTLPSEDEYEMEILAKSADTGKLHEVKSLIETGAFLKSEAKEAGINVHWPTSYMFHIALFTPDSPGLTDRLADIVGKERQVENPRSCPHGSFVHMVGITYNSGGPQGGTAYYSLRANVATQTLAIQEEIVAHLAEWAKRSGIGDGLWIRDLNPLNGPPRF